MTKSKNSLVVATRNKGKLVEFSRGLNGLGLEFLSLHDFPTLPPIVEDGSTFMENALQKARVTVEHTNLPALADDSGLEVDWLEGAPGVFSARFAGKEGDDEANNAKLLRLLREVPSEKRTARFRCALAFVTPEGEEIKAEGRVEGFIGQEPQGTGGFGYDPLFVVPDYNLTFAQLDVEEKNKISHRGRALAKLRQQLEEFFQTVG